MSGPRYSSPRRRAIVLVGATLLAASVLGAAKSGSAATPELKIAVNAPLSGAGASFGLPQEYTFQVLADQYNAQGGLLVGGTRYHVSIISDDDKWDPTATRSAVEKEINQDHVNFIATVGDPVDPIIVPVTEKSKVIVLDWTGNKYFLSKPYKYVLGTFVSPNVMGHAWYAALKQREPSIKTMYEVAVDLQFDRNNVKWEKQAAGSVGIKESGAVYYPPGTVDFTSALAKAVDAHPDLIALGSEGGSTAAIITALRQLGFKGVIASAVTANSLADAVKGAGAQADGYYQAELFGYPTTSGLSAFKSAYQHKSGGDWSTLAANFWIGAQFLFKSIQNAGTVSDTPKVMKAAGTTTITAQFVPGQPKISLGGARVYGQKRELNIPVAMNQYKNGKFTTLKILHFTT